MKLAHVTPLTEYYAIGEPPRRLSQQSRSPIRGLRPGIVLDTALYHLVVLSWPSGTPRPTYELRKGRAAKSNWRGSSEGSIHESGVPVLVPDNTYIRKLADIDIHTKWKPLMVQPQYIYGLWANTEYHNKLEDEQLAVVNEQRRLEKERRDGLATRVQHVLTKLSAPQPLKVNGYSGTLSFNHTDGGLQWFLDIMEEQANSIVLVRGLDEWKAQRSGILSILEGIDDATLSTRKDIFNFLIDNDDLVDEMREYIKDYEYEQEP